MFRPKFVAVLLTAFGLAADSSAAQSAGAILPVIGSAPETGIQLGVAYLRARQPADTLGTRPSSVMGNVIVTQERQVRAFIESDRWTAGNERRRQWGVIAMQYPLPFYGSSVNTPYERRSIENDALELWLTQSWKRRPNVWYSVGGRVVVNVSDGYLGPIDDVCTPSPFGVICPAVAWGPAGVDAELGHTTLLATLGRVYDTRDRLFAPSTGRFLDVTLSVANRLKDDDGFLRVRLDARSFRPVGRSTLALQGLVQATDGVPTVDQLVVMGSNSVLRGYEMGRLRDKALIGAQGELRGPTTLLNDRVGFVGFAGGAYMSHALGSKDGAFFPSAGGGIRWILDRSTRSAVRVDYAFGKDGNSGLYIAFNEAF